MMYTVIRQLGNTPSRPKTKKIEDTSFFIENGGSEKKFAYFQALIIIPGLVNF